MSETIGDPTFRLNVRARAVLELLSERLPTWAEYHQKWQRYEGGFQTYPWYNGRERGFALVYQPVEARQERLVIICAEHRNVDLLFVDVGEVTTPFENGVSVADEALPYDQMWQKRWDLESIEAAASKIISLCKSFYLRVKQVEKAEKAAREAEI